MAKFGPKDIKRLREATNAGMMDCKKALGIFQMGGFLIKGPLAWV